MIESLLVTEPARARLTQRQLVDYEEHRRTFLTWVYTQGKGPSKSIGYSDASTQNTAYRIDAFYRWVWDQRGYTTNITTNDADDYLLHLATSDLTDASRAKRVMSLKRLFRWKNVDWEPELSFHGDTGTTNPRDYLTMNERTAIREAALEYGSVPSYDDLSPERRSRWKAYLAQRFEKPKHLVTPDDWEKANGWKIPSLIWTTMDTGLRPIEVERAVVSWVDVGNEVLRIPKEESSKNADNWIVSIRSQTARMLGRWLDQRETEPRYDDTDTLWLTRKGNPYGSNALNYVLRRLCEIADIPTDHRDVSWYSIRHSVGTYMTREEDLAAAQVQLRHESEQTTMKYDQVPAEDRRDALDRIG